MRAQATESCEIHSFVGVLRNPKTYGFYLRNDCHTTGSTMLLEVLKLSFGVGLVDEGGKASKRRRFRSQSKTSIRVVRVASLYSWTNIVGQVCVLSDVSAGVEGRLAPRSLTNSFALNHEPYVQSSFRKEIGYHCRPTSQTDG